MKRNANGQNPVPAWLIGITSMALAVWAVLELAGVAASRPELATAEPATERLGARNPVPALELHRLLPDATQGLGAVVRLDGTVVGGVTGRGFWVRDLRDNIVFVALDAGIGSARRVDAGTAVRVVGNVALFPDNAYLRHLEQAGLVLPASALVVRDVMVAPVPGGVEIL